MSLTHPTVRKLLREELSGDPPIRVTRQDREATIREIRRRLERIDAVSIEEKFYHSEEQRKRTLCDFSISLPDRTYRGDSSRDEFRLSVGDDEELLLGRYSAEATVADLAEIEAFVHACLKRLRRGRALAAKRQKVRELKAHAVVAQVKKLAAELKFEFMTETDRQKLSLYVRLSDDQAVRMFIPFNKFDDVLPQLRSAIGSLLELNETGIRFKTTGLSQWGWRPQWISYKDE